MRAYVKAMLIAGTALGCGTMALAQSSSPFSGLFGGGEEIEGPVDLDIRVDGGDDGIANAIRNTSLIAGALKEERNNPQDVLAAARADYARILGTLYDQGYYSALIFITLDGVEAAEIAPLDAPAAVTNVVVTVDPGPRFRFSRAAIAPVAPDSDIPDEYAQGETAGTGTIKSAALAGVDGWRNQGHAKADLAGQQIVADHAQSTVDSQIALNPGPAVTFGKLNMTGYKRMKPRRLHKIAGLPEGEGFDPEELEDVRKRLRRTGVFSAITLEEAETLGPGNTMDVNLTVVEDKPRRIGAGFEISNIDGAQISAYWMHRNLLGGGERLRIDAEVSDIGSDNSGRDEEITFRIDRPATITADTTAYVETELAKMREDDYDSDAVTLGLGFTHIPNDDLTIDLGTEYYYERVTDDNGRRIFKVLAFPSSVTWDKRDEPTNAKSGFYLDGEATPFKGFDGTDSGLRLDGEARGYYSILPEDRLTFAGRARAGSVLGSDIQNTPRDYLFYSGGGGTVRGHSYESLGVEEIQGSDGPIKTGGMSIFNASAEIRYQLREKIGVVGFVDYGRVWTDEAWSGDSGWHAGVGAGVRYDTPIGPLRFDIATPLGNGDTDDGVQVYLGLGQAF
ncbi:autotransporter assembly complex protein TamA [Paracoccus homiensis]|uniref:autotransporter assembly complex protein TamA n=1 Tax=Paracoccus homiensis TaxID=364199 RepID=UPI00398D42F4